MLIDSHTHVNFSAFKDDWEKTIERALKNDVWMINVGTKFETSKRAIEIAEHFADGVFASAGLHPSHLEKREIDPCEEGGIPIKTKPELFDKKEFLKLASSPKFVAVGECGLDYFRIDGSLRSIDEIKEKQKDELGKQIDFALKIKKPLILHCRDAYQDLLSILRNYFSEGKKERGIVHFFSGSLPEAVDFIKLGFLISFSGVVTFTKDREVIINELPLDKILIETDAPYAAPVPYRGGRNEPLYVRYVAQKIAAIRDLKFEDIAEVTTQNAKRLFNI